jgi:serine/threonine protein kinase
VHRDLKPENIMVGTESEGGQQVVKLLDLGIAKMREIAGSDNGGNTALTMAGQVLGTPYYMSPEQWGEIPRDGSTEIDGRADIYSLGLVFYEMIAGRRCFSANTLHELRREHVTRTPRPLYEVVPDVPRGFSDAIERATAKDRDDRPATTAVLAAELRAGVTTAPAAQPSDTGANLAQTVTVETGVPTNADVNAPTILTSEALPTAAPSSRPANVDATVYEPARPQPSTPQPDMSAPSVAEPSATIAESASSITIPQAPKPAATPEVKKPATELPPSKSKTGVVIGAVVALIAVLAVGIGGFLFWNFSRSKQTGAAGPNISSSAETVNAPREVSRYWLELEPKTSGGKTTRVAGLVPLASGQSLRFHLAFTEEGYFYIFGPGGGNNAPTAFLTNKPLPDSGVTSNKVGKGVEFVFPNGEGLLALDKNPGTDTFTVIFARTQLSSPSFLNEPVTGEPLNAAQQAELKAFINKNQQQQPVTELDESKPGESFVRVKATPEQNNPIVFDIRIQHN